MVVTSSAACGGAAYAAQQGIPTLLYPAPDLPPAALVHELHVARGCEFVVLAGYLKLVPGVLRAGRSLCRRGVCLRERVTGGGGGGVNDHGAP